MYESIVRQIAFATSSNRAKQIQDGMNEALKLVDGEITNIEFPQSDLRAMTIAIIYKKGGKLGKGD